jgi:hypothetical protein
MADLKLSATPPREVHASTVGTSPKVQTNASTPMSGSVPTPGISGRDKSPRLEPRAQNLGPVADVYEEAEREAFAAAAKRADRPIASRRIDWQAPAARGRALARANVYTKTVGGAENIQFRRDLEALKARFDADASPNDTLAWLEETEHDPARRYALLLDLQRLVQTETPSADPGDRAGALTTAVGDHRARFRPEINLADDVGKMLARVHERSPAKSKDLRDAYFETMRGLDEDTVLHTVTLYNGMRMRGMLSELGQHDLKTAVDELNRAMVAVHENARATRFPGGGSNLALNGSSLVVHLQSALALCDEGVRRLTASGIRLAQEAGNTAAKKILAMTISPTHPTTIQALVESLAGPDPKAGLALTQEILAVIRRLDDSIWPSPAARDAVVKTVLQWCDRLQAEPAAAPKPSLRG